MSRTSSSILAAALMLGLGAGTVGCLDVDARHTIYLEPDGSLISEIVGLNIRSDSADSRTRLKEEREFLDELRDGLYERELFPGRPTSVRTTIIRSERPYAVVMTGRYLRVDEFFAATFDEWLDAIVLEARLEYLGDETRMIVDLWTGEEDTEVEPDPAAPAGATEGENEAECSVPEPTDDSPRIILTEGRFVKAEGFEIDGDLAILLPEERVAVRNGLRRYSLTWTTE